MKRFWLALLFLSVAVLCDGQELIRGIVVDSATFSPLSNVNVKIKNKYQGATTDAKGNFSLNGSKQDTLVLSRVGYHYLELPLYDYEVSMIRMSEKETLLAPIIINDSRIHANPYEGMFDDQNALLKKRIPFYFSKARKDKLKAANWREESMRVQTYIDVVVNNPETKTNLMRKHRLTEDEYYGILTKFNERHYTVMYHLTAAELLSLLNKFFEDETTQR